MAAVEFDPLVEANELRSQLASEKRRLAFFFGAPTSQSVGIDGLAALTSAVPTELENSEMRAYGSLLALDNPALVKSF